MGRQIRLLAKIQLINLFGINEVRHTKDKKKQARFVGLGVIWLLLVLMVIFYVAAFAFGFVLLGMEEVVPMYLYAVTSLIILFFSLFKAGSVIFQMNTYEILVSLPVSKAAIVVSRFLTMYVTNLLLAFLVMLPGTVVYGVLVQPGVSFYLYSIMGTLVLPLLPLTIATALGAGITAVSSRMRSKGLVYAGLTLVLALGAIVVSMLFSGNVEQLNEEIIKNLASMIGNQIGSMYPPAIWFSDAAVDGRASGFLLLAGCSVLIFTGLIALLQKYFQKICSALNATSARNNYKMTKLSSSSPLAALWKRELKRYFASGIYVSNTSIGYILMAIMGVALFFVGTEKIEETLQLPGIVTRALPLMYGFCAVMMPTTSCAVSMEGKQWWIAQTLPIKTRDIWNSKLLVNLTIAFPFYIVAVIFGVLAVKPSLVDGIWLVAVPFVYILFSAVAGLTINLAMPVLDWENETNVVKQSASTLISMLAGFAGLIPPAICLFIFPAGSEQAVYLLTTVILLGITTLLHLSNMKKGVIF